MQPPWTEILAKAYAIFDGKHNGTQRNLSIIADTISSARGSLLRLSQDLKEPTTVQIAFSIPEVEQGQDRIYSMIYSESRPLEKIWFFQFISCLPLLFNAEETHSNILLRRNLKKLQ